jgi:branched-chain amino acid transport system ATP-binding protein
MPILDVEDLYVGYYHDINILQGVSLHAKRKQLTAIIGPNGVGKSTLLKSIFGYLKPNNGKIIYQNKEINGVPPYELCREGIAYIPQHQSVFANMTVIDNIKLGGWTFRRDNEKVRKKIEESFNRFPELFTRQKNKAGNFSGGQQRMIELCRSLMLDPKLLLLDEPTAGLAPLVAKTLYNKIDELKDEDGIAIILIDQNIRQAIRYADYVYVLELGKNLIDGPRNKFDNITDTIKGWI